MTDAASDSVVVELTKDEALVLFEWLVERRAAGDKIAGDEMRPSAEYLVLSTMEAALEPRLDEVFRPDYKQLVQAARARLQSV
jgi:hypothetical protein